MITLDGALRCNGCGKKLASELKGEVAIVCPRCKQYNVFRSREKPVLSAELFVTGLNILRRDIETRDRDKDLTNELVSAIVKNKV